MSQPGVFLAVYPGEMAPGDLAALDQPCFEVFVNGIGVTEPVWHRQGAPHELVAYQVVRISATSAGDAHRRIVDALGREPDGLRVQAADT